MRDLDLTIQIPGLLKVAEPYVIYVFRMENVRILADLKRYIEEQPKQCDLNPSLGKIERPCGNEVRDP
jgi:hypothetical protein